MLVSFFFPDSNMVEHPGPARFCLAQSEWSDTFNTSRPQANKWQTDSSFRPFQTEPSKNFCEQNVKVTPQKRRISAALLSPVLALILPDVSEADPSCYSDDPTTRKTDHIRLTANKEQLLHKEGKEIKERTTEQTGINTEARFLTWMQVVQPVHEKTTTAGWAFHFLHVPLIRELLVLYLLQCDWFF